MQRHAFWTDTPLEKMTSSQWESLCDGCGKCCVLKLEDVDTGVVHYTDVGCQLLDCTTARCRDYSQRKSVVPDCVMLTADSLHKLAWMPSTCAYRLLFEGKDLPEWHPLVTGDRDSPRRAGHSVAGRIFPESDIDEDDLPDHITEW